LSTYSIFVLNFRQFKIWKQEVFTENVSLNKKYLNTWF